MYILDNPPVPGQTFELKAWVLWNSKHSFVNLYDTDMSEVESYHLLGEVTVPFTTPEGFDGPKLAVASLEAQKTKLMAEYQKAMTHLTGQINSFLALENNPK